MRFAQDTLARFAVRPSVCLSMLWGGVVYAWFVYAVHTLKYSVENGVYGIQFIDGGRLLLGTGVNLGLLLALLLDLRLSLRSPRSVRSGYLVGIALALLVLCLLESLFLTWSRFHVLA